MLWAWLLAEVWVVVRVVAGRGKCRWGWLVVCSTLWFIRWPRIGSSCWPVRGRFWCRWGWLFVCSRLWLCSMAEVWVVVLAVVGVGGVGFVGVRGCGRGCWPRVGLSRVLLAPFAWRHPTGFAGVSFATVSGLVVGWSSRCLLMVVVVVDGVGHTGVRGCGRSCWPRCGS